MKPNRTVESLTWEQAERISKIGASQERLPARGYLVAAKEEINSEHDQERQEKTEKAAEFTLFISNDR